MQCGIFVAVKPNSIPIQECGNVTLQDGDRLLVDINICGRITVQYHGYLIQVGTCEEQLLAGGHYEYRPAQAKAVKAIADDRSMMGRNKMRRG